MKLPGLQGVLCDNCQTRSYTWAAECFMCHKTKYPTMAEPGPGKDWICAACRADSPRARSAKERVRRDGPPRKRRSVTNSGDDTGVDSG